MPNCPYAEFISAGLGAGVIGSRCNKPDGEECPDGYGPTTDCECHEDYYVPPPFTRKDTPDAD